MRLTAVVLFWPLLAVCAALVPVMGILRLALWSVTYVADRLMPLVEWLAVQADKET